tara:strand:+ start:267 stop:743 length:477 start_codon:yes stop_codon:yes gene_type:complete
MSLIYKNITGSTEVILIDSYTNGSTSQKLDNVSLCNVHATDSVNVDLYYCYTIYQQQLSTDWNAVPAIEVIENDDGTTTESIFIYYVIKNVTIPKGTTLNLDTLSFDNNLYQLKIKLNNSDSAVDLVIDAEIEGTITTTSVRESASTASSSAASSSTY